jgi:hypothetical protein
MDALRYSSLFRSHSTPEKILLKLLDLLVIEYQ